MPRLNRILTVNASLHVLTGLRVGAENAMMQIGGVDMPVLRHPYTRQPYLPGSSIKGKMRSLLEWRSGAVQAEPLGHAEWLAAASQPAQQAHLGLLLRLFGVGGGDTKDKPEFAALIGPTRLSFWDCPLEASWAAAMREHDPRLTEIKTENRINRITGTAEHPRDSERVPAGARFEFRLSAKVLDQDDEAALRNMVLDGLRLIELDGLGGSLSRGYGKVRFEQLSINGEAAELDGRDPFANMASVFAA